MIYSIKASPGIIPKTIRPQSEDRTPGPIKYGRVSQLKTGEATQISGSD